MEYAHSQGSRDWVASQCGECYACKQTQSFGPPLVKCKTCDARYCSFCVHGKKPLRVYADGSFCLKCDPYVEHAVDFSDFAIWIINTYLPGTIPSQMMDEYKAFKKDQLPKVKCVACSTTECLSCKNRTTTVQADMNTIVETIGWCCKCSGGVKCDVCDSLPSQ